MKSNSKLILGLVFLGALGWAGCQTTQFPTSYLSTTGPDPSLVTDFESGYLVNMYLAEANKPNNKLKSPGTVVLGGYASSVVTVAPSVLALSSPGYNGTGQCAHVTGSFIDAGNAAYPALTLQIPLEAANQYYDGSFFTGVKFYYKTSSSDVAALRSFSIPVAVTTTASGGGTCDQPPFTSTNNPCYNNFGYNLSNTGGSWQFWTIPFSSLTRQSYGPVITPSTLSGVNLQQILMLAWSEGNSNSPGTVNVDFSVDEVKFY